MNIYAKKRLRDGPPTVSKIAVILFGVLTVLCYAGSMYVEYFRGRVRAMPAVPTVYFAVRMVAVVLLLLGVFIRRAPALYGAGLAVFALDWVAVMIFTAAAGEASFSAESILGSILIVSSVLLIVTAFHYFLRGRGISKFPKNVAIIFRTSLPVLVSLNSFIYDLHPYATRYGPMGVAYLIVSTVLPIPLAVATAAYSMGE